MVANMTLPELSHRSEGRCWRFLMASGMCPKHQARRWSKSLAAHRGILVEPLTAARNHTRIGLLRVGRITLALVE